LRFSGPKTSIICSPMTSLKTSIKTITYLSDIGCLEIQGASLVTKAIPFQSGIFADVWRVTQERYYQVKKVCRTALINPALICLKQFGVSFSKQTLTIANDL
ncbi:hypothetical protein JZL85_24560, partial [Escherichia coli]|nr:hypothetical protein [Escherichia coli]